MNGPPDPISSIFVETSRAKEAFGRIDTLFQFGWEKTYCRALLLAGPSRSGKTTIVDRYIESRLNLDGQAERPPIPSIVKVDVTQGSTLKSHVTEVLIKLGDPDPEYGSQAEKTRRVAESIQRHGVSGLVFDETHWLTDSDSKKIKSDVSQWIASLLNRRVCPILFVGETRAERIFETGDYAEGRTMGEVEIRPYDWGSEKDRLEFRAVLHQIDKLLAMPEPAGLGEIDTSIRIYIFCRGLLGQATRLIGDTRLMAKRLGRPRLTHDLFADAIDMLRIGSARRRPNPFRVENPQLISPAPMHVEDDGHRLKEKKE
jgi:hypothetical protein